MKKLALALAPFLFTACVTSGRSSMEVVSPATAADRAALLDRIKSLEGAWTATNDEGTITASVFTVSSNGSAVREVMMPGTQHEMTNMYTMDGHTLLLTHYCAMGNQPHMRAKAEPSSNSIRFEPDGVSNLQKDQGYMSSLTLTFVDKDHLRAEWHSVGIGEDANPTTFELTRHR